MPSNGSETHSISRTEMVWGTKNLIDFVYYTQYNTYYTKFFVQHGGYLMKKHVNNIFNSYTKESCYWAGFLAADGSIDINSTIGIELNAKDKKSVLQFKTDLASEHVICYREVTDAYRIRFCDKEIAESLAYNFSVTVDKTHNLQLPMLPEEMYPHYIRGHFDGDGCFTEFFNNRPMASFRVYITSGSLEFLQQLCSFLISIGVTKGSSISKKAANCWHIQYGIKDATSFLNYIYQDNTVESHRLDRKYAMYKRIIIDGIRAKREIKV